MLCSCFVVAHHIIQVNMGVSWKGRNTDGLFETLLCWHHDSHKLFPCQNHDDDDVDVNIKVIDSFNHLPMSLSKLPQAFGLSELKKGYFPYMFNTLNNQNCVGSYPDVKLYSPELMSSEHRTTFLIWYAGKKDDVFDFKQEMLDYCRSDVDILRRACMKYIINRVNEQCNNMVLIR